MQGDAATSIEEQKQRIVRIECRLQNAENAGNVQLMETYAKMLVEATKDLAVLERSMLHMAPMAAIELPPLLPPPPPPPPYQEPEFPADWTNSGSFQEFPAERLQWSGPSPPFGEPLSPPSYNHPPMQMPSSRPPVMKPTPSESVLPLSVATALGDSLGQNSVVGHSGAGSGLTNSATQSRSLSCQMDQMEYLRLHHRLMIQVTAEKEVAVKSEGWASELPSSETDKENGATTARLAIPSASAPAEGEWELTLCQQSGFGAVLLKAPENSTLLTFSPHQWPILIRRGYFLSGELAPFIVQQLKARLGTIERKPRHPRSDEFVFDDVRSLIRSMELIVSLLGKKPSPAQESNGSGRPPLSEPEASALQTLQGLASVARGWLLPIAEAIFLSVGGVASTEYPRWLLTVASAISEGRSQPSSPTHETSQDLTHSRKRARIT